MATSKTECNLNQQSFTIDSSSIVNNGNETPILCDIKLLCKQRKKRSKRHVYLTFIESCSIQSNELACLEIIDKTNISTISLNQCISFEYFDSIKNDFQSFIYIYFPSYTVSIYFSDENLYKKSIIIKNFQYMFGFKCSNIHDQQSSQDHCDTSTSEYILHTFDIKLIPCAPIISRQNILIGSARLYFTVTDLYITSIDMNKIDLKTIINQCPLNNENVLCIPYFTIRHYGNRSNIFLIELGKSNYGNGEVHMKCRSSSLASTIHLLVSSVIEERPFILSSAFQNQLLTNKRIEKSKHIHPPIQLNNDSTTTQSNNRPSLSSIRQHSTESTSEKSTKLKNTKSHYFVGLVRRLVKKSNPLQRSVTLEVNRDESLEQQQQSNILSSSMSKFFEFNIQEKNIFTQQNEISHDKSQIQNHSIKLNYEKNTQGSTNETYIDMGLKREKSQQDHQEEMKHAEPIKEPTTTTPKSVDIGVNTTISLPSHVRSAFIIGNSVHLIAEERSIFPIGQRSFTSPASIMQPFKAQLAGEALIHTNENSAAMKRIDSNNSNSQTKLISTTNSQQSLLLSYGIVTFNKNPIPIDEITRTSSSLSNESTIDRRLNSDISLMSASHQRQPSNIYFHDNVLSSSSSSHIFRTLSLSTNNIGENRCGQSHTSIIFFDENLTDQTTSYLLGPPPPPIISPETTINDETNSTTSISRSHLSNIDEEKSSLNDSYALIQPLSLCDSTKPLLKLKKSVYYTDVFLPLNTGDEQQELIYPDENNDVIIEEKTERSSTIIYTDIDFHKTQQRDRIAQFAAIPKNDEQIPPFVL